MWPNKAQKLSIPHFSSLSLTFTHRKTENTHTNNNYDDNDDDITNILCKYIVGNAFWIWQLHDVERMLWFSVPF